VRHASFLRALAVHDTALTAADLAKRLGLFATEVHMAGRWLLANGYITRMQQVVKAASGKRETRIFWRLTEQGQRFVKSGDGAVQDSESQPAE
jgi:DNA-binding MarR family transcriptional regulator